MKQFIASAAIFAATVSAIPVWQQCGGQDWTGSGTCDSGTTCVKQNDCKLKR
jgi:endo-1,4-beta-xylanase